MSNQTGPVVPVTDLGPTKAIAELSEYAQRLENLASLGFTYDRLSNTDKTDLLAFYMRQMPVNEAPDLLGCLNDIQAKAWASGMSRILEDRNEIAQKATTEMLTNIWLDTYDAVFRQDLEDAIWKHAEDERERRADRASQAEYRQEGC